MTIDRELKNLIKWTVSAFLLGAVLMSGALRELAGWVMTSELEVALKTQETRLLAEICESQAPDNAKELIAEQDRNTRIEYIQAQKWSRIALHKETDIKAAMLCLDKIESL